MDKIWLARFIDYDYPGDSEIFGAYATEQEAKDRIAEELKLALARSPNYPDMNDKKDWNYRAECVEFQSKQPQQ